MKQRLKLKKKIYSTNTDSWKKAIELFWKFECSR